MYDGAERVGTDRNDDDAEPVTEINVEVDPSLIAEITFGRTSESAILVSADVSSPADSEPRTIEPQTLQPNLSVRGLSPGSEEPATPHRVPFETDEYEDNDDKTSRNGFGAVITPSEPFRITSGKPLEITATDQNLSSASLRAARVSETDLGEKTAKRVPHREDVEDETATDAMRTLGSSDESPDSKTEVVAARATDAIIGSITVSMSDDRRGSEEIGNEGRAGTMRMAFPKATSELVYEPSAAPANAPAATQVPSTDPMRPSAPAPPPLQPPTIPPPGYAGPSAPTTAPAAA